MQDYKATLQDYQWGIVEWDHDGFGVINRLVEQGVKALPPDFREYRRDTQFPSPDSRGPIVETNELTSMDERKETVMGLVYCPNADNRIIPIAFVVPSQIETLNRG